MDFCNRAKQTSEAEEDRGALDIALQGRHFDQSMAGSLLTSALILAPPTWNLDRAGTKDSAR